MQSTLVIKSLFFTLVILAAVLEASGDIILKKWTIEQKNMLFIAGLLVYFIATVLWAFSLKYEFLSKAISIVTILNLIIVLLVGILYFKEDVSFISKIGMITGIISIILMQY